MRIAIGLCDTQEDTLYLDIYIYKVAVSLEVVRVLGVVESEEGDGVGHHPDVAAAAVEVGLGPEPVLVCDCQHLLLLHRPVCSRVVLVLVVAWGRENTLNFIQFVSSDCC